MDGLFEDLFKLMLGVLVVCVLLGAAFASLIWWLAT